MQTFLPYPDFRQSAAALDTARLGKQRVEALQTLRALVIPEYGWQTHPAVRMWMGYVPALTMYGLAMVDEWTERGHRGQHPRQHHASSHPRQPTRTTRPRSPCRRGSGNPDFHLSHRSKLLRKEPKFYKTVFPDAEPDLDYIWPEPKHEFLPADPEDDFLWILREPARRNRPGDAGHRGPAAGPPLGACNRASRTATPPYMRTTGPAALPSSPASFRPRRSSSRSPRGSARPRRRRSPPCRARPLWRSRSRTAAKFAVGQVLGRPITLDDGRFGRNFSVTEVIDRSAFDYPALLQDPRVFFPVPAP